MLRKLRFLSYLWAVALATPGMAAPLDEALATGPMRALAVVAGEVPATGPLSDIDGGSGDLSEYRGRVVVLNFWATWCAPCRAEMPSLQALQDALGPEGLSVVTVAFGRHAPAAMRRFWDEAGVTDLPLYLDPDTALARPLGVRGLPHTMLLDREGRIAGEVVGEADWTSPEALAVMRRLLAP